MKGKQIRDAITSFIGTAGAGKVIKGGTNGKIHPSLIDSATGSYPNFDQEAVPTSPAIGNSWIERYGDGSIKHSWQWNGVLWLSQDSSSAELFKNSGNNNGSGNGVATMPGMPFDCDLLIENLIISLVMANSIAPGGGNDSNLVYYSFGLQKVVRNVGTQIGTMISQQGVSYVAGWNVYKIHPINTLVSFAGSNQDSTNTIARGLRAFWTRSSGSIQFSSSCFSIAYRLARR
jgi:hypothetical protein